MNKTEIRRTFEDIVDWAQSRDGSHETDDEALTTIIEIAERALAKLGPGRKV